MADRTLTGEILETSASMIRKQFIPGLGTALFSVRYVPFFSVLLKERSVLFRSFFEFLGTYETKRTQRTQHSFAKKVKERKECDVLL